MDYGRPPILFVAVWGLFAAAMLFAQFELTVSGSGVPALADAENPIPIIEMASIELPLQHMSSTSAPTIKAEAATFRVETLDQ